MANHHGDKIPNCLEPVVQTVQSLVASEGSSDTSDWANSSADDDSSDSDSDSEEEKPSKKCCHKSNNNKKNKSRNKGKGPATNNKNACPLHPKSNYHWWQCDKLKEIVGSSAGGNNKNKANFASSSRYGANNGFSSGAAASRDNPDNVNWCRFCRHVPFVLGHQCNEMLCARRANNNNNNNTTASTIRSCMSHVTLQLEQLLEVDDDELMNSSTNNKDNGQYNSLLQYSHNIKNNHLKNKPTILNDSNSPSAIYVPIILQDNICVLALLDLCWIQVLISHL